jgi:hypothetical protein
VVRIRRWFGDALISIAALAVLLTLIASVNERVRQEVSLRLTSTHAQADIAEVAADMHDAAGTVIEAARHQSIEHAPLLVFVIAACVLVAFMLRL